MVGSLSDPWVLAVDFGTTSSVPPTIPGCMSPAATKPFSLRRATQSPTLCDQSYTGYADKLMVLGQHHSLYVGLVRCGATLDVLEWLTPDIKQFDAAAPAFPKFMETILSSSARKLDGVVG